MIVVFGLGSVSLLFIRSINDHGEKQFFKFMQVNIASWLRLVLASNCFFTFDKANERYIFYKIVLDAAEFESLRVYLAEEST